MEKPDSSLGSLGPSGKQTGLSNPSITPETLRDQYLAARAQLDADVTLLARALDLGEVLWFGVLDMDEARQLVAELKRDSALASRRRGA